MNRPKVAALYLRVSTAAQVETGGSLDAQEATLRAEAARRGLGAVLFREEGKSAKNMNRPELQKALALLDKGGASLLLAVRLDRVSRSVADFALLMDRAAKKGWGIAFTDSAIDTTNPAGVFTANVLASAAQYERALIGVRTREGMAQKKAEGSIFGRLVVPESLPVYERVLALHAEGKSLSSIAAVLNSEQVPTFGGGAQWRHTNIRRILTSETAKRLAS